MRAVAPTCRIDAARSCTRSFVLTHPIPRRPTPAADFGFTLKGVKRGPAKLRALLIGYREQNIMLSGDSGTVVRIGMHAQALRACGLVVRAPGSTGVPAVTAVVRDVQTGGAPSSAVMLHLKDRGFADSAVGVAASEAAADSIEVGGALNRKGSYAVDVNADGYAPWHLIGATTTDECGNFVGRRIRIWLLPTSRPR